MQAVSQIYIPNRLASASDLYGGLGVAVVALGWLFIIGRTLSFAMSLNVALFDRFGSLSQAIFALPVLRVLPARSTPIRTYFGLDDDGRSIPSDVGDRPDVEAVTPAVDVRREGDRQRPPVATNSTRLNASADTTATAAPPASTVPPVNVGVWVLLLVLVPSVLVVLWVLLVETSVRVEPGTLGLALVRGKSTGRTMTPGRHFMMPWRKVMIQTYPSRELALVAGGIQQSNPDVDYLDEPVTVFLADHSVATVSYTVRCQLIPKRVHDVHEAYGPEGIWSVLRDLSRHTVIAETARSGVTSADAFGEGYTTLERHVTERLAAELGQIGFDLKLFSLRTLDLGETGEVIQSSIRADAELHREQALAAVRRARIENDAALLASVDDLDYDLLLRYRQVESWRDLIQRWSGRTEQVPAAITAQLRAESAWQAAVVEHEHLDESQDVDGVPGPI